MQIVVALVLNALALYITSKIVPGFSVTDSTSAILASIVLGVVNTFIKPVLSFVTAPLTIITLGLFAFVVNAVVLFIVAWVVPGFDVDGWLPAILGGIVLAVVSTVISSALKDLGKLVK